MEPKGGTDGTKEEGTYVIRIYRRFAQVERVFPPQRTTAGAASPHHIELESSTLASTVSLVAAPPGGAAPYALPHELAHSSSLSAYVASRHPRVRVTLAAPTAGDTATASEVVTGRAITLGGGAVHLVRDGGTELEIVRDFARLAFERDTGGKGAPWSPVPVLTAQLPVDGATRCVLSYFVRDVRWIPRYEIVLAPDERTLAAFTLLAHVPIIEESYARTPDRLIIVSGDVQLPDEEHGRSVRETRLRTYAYAERSRGPAPATSAPLPVAKAPALPAAVPLSELRTREISPVQALHTGSETRLVLWRAPRLVPVRKLFRHHLQRDAGSAQTGYEVAAGAIGEPLEAGAGILLIAVPEAATPRFAMVGAVTMRERATAEPFVLWAAPSARVRVDTDREEMSVVQIGHSEERHGYLVVAVTYLFTTRVLNATDEDVRLHLLFDPHSRAITQKPRDAFTNEDGDIVVAVTVPPTPPDMRSADKWQRFEHLFVAQETRPSY